MEDRNTTFDKNKPFLVKIRIGKKRYIFLYLMKVSHIRRFVALSGTVVIK